MSRITLLLIFLSSFLYSQQITQITVVDGESSLLVPSYNHQGKTYISIKHLTDALHLKNKILDEGTVFEIFFREVILRFNSKNPYIIISNNKSEKLGIYQFPTSTHFIDNSIFVPLSETIELINKYYDKSIVVISPGKIIILEKDQKKICKIESITLEQSSKGTFLIIKSNIELTSQLTFVDHDSFTLTINNASTFGNSFDNLIPIGFINHIGISNINQNIEISIKKKNPEVGNEFFYNDNNKELVIHLFERADSPWLERESEHFKVVYRKSHSAFINTILASAEKSFNLLSRIFDYQPSDKIIINTYDVNDYGFASASTTPQNFIRLEIEPLEPGYEFVPFNERIQWLLSHELVHIIVNDAEVEPETFYRSIFGKVPPEKIQPLSALYSFFTNFNRYSPRWHQEGIAIFFETWLSGGFGRILGSFDEMYFRTSVHEGMPFPSQLDLETILSHNSIVLENIHYIYGGRFLAYLSITYGSDKVVDWFRTIKGDAFTGFEGKFREVFNKDFYSAWADFISYEIKFQEENISVLEKSELTELRKLNSENFGWVSNPCLDRPSNSLYYIYHRSGQLCTLQSLNLSTGISNQLTSIATPSMLQVSSIALDEANGLLFYTTNNNQLYRDIWAYQLETGDEKMLFENARVGDLTVSPQKHELWGVQHDAGFATLVRSPYPYKELITFKTFGIGDEIYNLSIDDSGRRLAAVIKKASGIQSIVIINTDGVAIDSLFEYKVISSSGSPENPSWSEDGKFLYWNAYTNGVSNIFRFDFNSLSTKAITNCVTGLFRPLEILPDSIFAFEYFTNGFKPVIFKNEPANFLPAINYLGQRVIEENPKLYSWNLNTDTTNINPMDFSLETNYNAFENLHLQALFPMVSGFQNQVVFGLFTRISDPLLIHDFYLSAGVSPLSENPSYPLWHFRFKYDYKQLLFFEVLYNGDDFFDLFNKLKRGMLGEQYKIGHTYYWLYDNPLKIKQASTLTLYRNVEYVYDNLVRVSQPDFAVLATNLNSKNLRKTIGSSDYEYGNELNWTVALYGTEFDQPEVAVNTYADFSNYRTWLWKHNVLHVKIAGGYLWYNENLVQSKFYFGGFGNRPVDNDEVKQFRRIFRFPGISIYSLDVEEFGKLMLENDFPPIRVSDWILFDQFVNHFDFSIYSQGLITESYLGNYLVDIGAQMDIKLKHWYNLESTFSAGIAKAWVLPNGMADWEWFLSIKLLKD
jgi:WD40-like Beta Propeller Repeat